MAGKPLRVVLVDDNYDASAALARLLEVAGFHVTARAYDGFSGFNAIQLAKPDVAILDIAMPTLDGYALARKIRREIMSPPRLVALTACSTESDETEAFRAGFDAFFRKPVDWSKLEALLLAHEPELVSGTRYGTSRDNLSSA